MITVILMIIMIITSLIFVVISLIYHPVLIINPHYCAHNHNFLQADVNNKSKVYYLKKK